MVQSLTSAKSKFLSLIPRLFDLGLIAVVPAKQTLDLAPSIREYSQYSSLQGSRLTVLISRRELKWLKRHWDEHRGTTDG